MNETSAGAVIFTENEERLFLLLGYPSGHWDFVKGKMEAGESALQTAIRETYEETGIKDLEFLDGFEESIRYDFKFRGELIHKKVVFYLAKTHTTHVEISHEHLGFSWLNYEDAVKKTTYDNARRVLSRAVRRLS